MEPEKRPHQLGTPRERLTTSDVAILRDIGNQLNLLEQLTPESWQQFLKSLLASKNISIERLAGVLNREGEMQKLETLYDLLMDATGAHYNNDNYEKSAGKLVDDIIKLAA